MDTRGNVYLSDSRKSLIYRFSQGSFEEWLKDEEIEDPNGLHIHGKRLLVGNNGDRSIKSVDLKSKKISTLARLGPGIIDGIKTDRDDSIIVSHWQGRIYRITTSGDIIKLLDTSGPECFCADFEYVPSTGMLFIPTFIDNRIATYQIRK